MKYDLVIKNARTRFSANNSIDIGIENGIIVKIGQIKTSLNCNIINANGNLVTESFINGHLHLCKVYSLLNLDNDKSVKCYTQNKMACAMEAIERASIAKNFYNEETILTNARKALNLAIKFGNTHIRVFGDTDTKAKLVSIEALLKIKKEFCDKLDLKIVAFPQEGIIRDPGAIDYVTKGIEIGADIVGGIPWIEYTESDAQEHINLVFEVAKKYNKDISMLVDDAGDPGLRTLEMLSIKTIKEGWEGRVTAQHARAMHLYPEPYYKKLEFLLKKAKIGVICNPHTGPLHARIKSLYEADINVGLGQDDIVDAYYPFGRNNMLEIAFLVAHLLWLNSNNDLDMLYDLITTKAANALGIENFGLKTGNNANLVLLNAKNIHEAILNHEPPLMVIKNGIIISNFL